MTYDKKVSQAHSLIKSALENSRNPAVMCSFGKDSIVVLHMVMQYKKLKVVFHRHPFQHHRYEYAHKVISEWDLHVIDYAPAGTAVSENENETNIVSYYQVGQKPVYLPTGLVQTDCGKNTLCALDEVYGRPTGTFNYPFDLVFHGHKSVDVDPVLGGVPLFTDVALNVGSVSAAYPIRHFTNEDVWSYIEDHDIPINHLAYERKEGKWVAKQDKSGSPDYLSCCFSCLSTKTGNNVHCPKWGRTVSNVSNQVRWANKPDLSYLRG